MKEANKALSKRKMEIMGGLLLVAVVVLPFFTFAGSRKDIYVDGSKKGEEKGTQEKPYHTISEALAHSNGRTDVHVAKGVYSDNIEIPKGVRVFGTSQHEVIIRAKKSNKVVVSMKDDSEINKVTIEKGREGIWVKEDAEVSIIKTIVRDNDKDGIKIGKGSIKKDDPVIITDSLIENNGRAGIYSQKRRLVLIDNEITKNESDGMDIASGASAWIENNRIKDNDGSGMKLTLDQSNIWTKSNTFRDNDHGGLEVNANGGEGRIDINKSKFLENKTFGVARISRNAGADKTFNGLTIQDNNVFEMTKLGTVSPIMNLR